MSYTPNNWTTGDVITAAKLNNIEQGIANAQTFIVNITTEDGETYTADKTYEEALSAYNSGMIVLLRSSMQFPGGQILTADYFVTGTDPSKLIAVRTEISYNDGYLMVTEIGFLFGADGQIVYKDVTYTIPNVEA